MTRIEYRIRFRVLLKRHIQLDILKVKISTSDSGISLGKKETNLVHSDKAIMSRVQAPKFKLTYGLARTPEKGSSIYDNLEC